MALLDKETSDSRHQLHVQIRQVPSVAARHPPDWPNAIRDLFGLDG
jgi:hypothetical protein